MDSDTAATGLGLGGGLGLWAWLLPLHAWPSDRSGVGTGLELACAMPGHTSQVYDSYPRSL